MSLALKIMGYQVDPVSFSDHAMITGSFCLDEAMMCRKGAWKLNCSCSKEEGVDITF